MSSITSPAIIHVRDFIDNVEPDPSRPDLSSNIQLLMSLNVPPPVSVEEESDDVECGPIQTSIRFFCPRSRLYDYERNMFAFTWGPFHTVGSGMDTELIINAYNVQWFAYTCPRMLRASTETLQSPWRSHRPENIQQPLSRSRSSRYHRSRNSRPIWRKS
jgi:hypothetical protein